MTEVGDVVEDGMAELLAEVDGAFDRGRADGIRGRAERFAVVLGDRAPDLVARERASGRWPY